MAEEMKLRTVRGRTGSPEASLIRVVDTRGAGHEQSLKNLALGGSGLSVSCLSFIVLEALGLHRRLEGKRNR